MVDWNTDYLAAGGNRHPSAADWDLASGLLAFGADRNVALWSPQDDGYQGVTALLHGHTDIVNVVRFFPAQEAFSQTILSGSVDKTIRVWQAKTASPTGFDLAATLEGHESSINCLAVFKGTDIFASGSADATIRIWRIESLGYGMSVKKLQTIQTKPRFFPLALALHSLGAAEDLVLAAAGTKSIVQIYVASTDSQFFHQVTLPGHEGWIRSLSITQESDVADSDLLLASASQDKYIRLWRIIQERPKDNLESVSASGNLEKFLSNKAHKLKTSQNSYSVSFEALLLGHEDWIYTISWRLGEERLQLLSASADNSLAIWESEQSSGVWVCTTRLGEISAQKGSTTATGSTGGFYIGLWSPKGDKLISLGRTGSWRLWNYDLDQDRWLQGIGISGHTKAVADVAWSKDGSYLFSTGSDQTTRLHAAWKRGRKCSWHEMARPQIHGYCLNCIDSNGQIEFISGADEKLLRVFEEPRATADLLDALCGIHTNVEQTLPDAANIPVLGLSNKAIESAADEVPNTNGHADAENLTSTAHGQTLNEDHPPLEDQLARHTLWPEKEKLYGHGYEISAVASSHDGTVVATSCRASSLEHAVIRLYTTKDWREVRPSLTAHSLTVTALCFSSDDRYLISVGRDRQWAVFERDCVRPEEYLLKHSNPKGHSRMILDACWAPLEAGRVFATAGRDRTVKIWSISATGTECTTTITAASSVTAVDISSRFSQNNMVTAIGTETGNITLHILKLPNWTVKQKFELDNS
ncbi:hypothetical protein HO133_000277 [Letharia lupina]|uniref:Elongator complex protein 2 n=1 Tax=Letharia lupina TaxID=560253 RepID=A0A8H6CHQ4_9LECA|nr:uncharacterized protein HO133_000277 [Letharia lupina]KAF6223434.1 hypothetical protein HO133_000277 [Letharia lupina]